ncbi:hypothetical protein [Amaricoccus sp.]|uniref:hypothetical protein n=1 Tax=Amaricoccus sp. TaxID=1872485 RepID=UPI001B50D7C2|nr:hypothetical protein [Amaricoccus sp.]MBP7001811.1 hypothetical protein [Amaricoccus sp.]
MATLIHNERTKLTATFINGMALTVFAVGGLAPFIAAAYGAEGPRPVLLLMALYCLGVSFTLHYLARRVLGKLTP